MTYDFLRIVVSTLLSFSAKLNNTIMRIKMKTETIRKTARRNFSERLNLAKPFIIKKHFLPLLKPYFLLIAGAVISLIIFSLTSLTLPYVLKIAIDDVLPNKNIRLLTVGIISIVLIFGIRLIFFYISHYLTYYTSQKILFDIRRKLFQHLQKLSVRFYQTHRTGKLISNVITDVGVIQQLISSTLINLAVHCFLIILVMICLFIINWQLALICLVVIPFHAANFLYFKKEIRKNSLVRQEKVSEISGNLAEILTGSTVVKSFAKEKTESKHFITDLRKLFDMNLTIVMQGVWSSTFADILVLIGRLIALGSGAWFVFEGHMSIGEFVCFYSYLGMLFPSIVQLSSLSQVIAQGSASMTRIGRLLEESVEVEDEKNPITTDSFKGNIEFKNVTFAYYGKAIIKDFSLNIKPGQSIAFVGQSGSGKSTIANLLVRFFDVTGGSIHIDGNDIRKYKMSNLRKNIGIVQQTPFLFSGTIFDNISYAKDGSSLEEVIEAAKKANIHEFIEEQEDKYDTVVGENGVNLSGGQRQRLSIARTLLKNPDILILDEATSALDNHSEKEVQKALEALMKGRTTITIAHRLSTIKNADSIIVLENGRIKQQGNHNELLSKDGPYKELYLLNQEGEHDETKK